MNQNNTVETIIGAIVVAIAAAFIWFAYTTTNAGGLGGYEVTGDLARVDGLSVGTDVRLSGIKVGTVSDLTLKPNYLVTVPMRIHNDVKIPTDSSLVVTSSGVLGSSYLSISPGGDDSFMKAGDKFGHTQGSVDLMGLVGRFINQGGGQQQGQGQQGQQKPGGGQPPANKPPQPQANGPAPLPKGPGP
jgi:phospholipid/cholesterol/gamma-HCH transport system substrate-binding protein